MAIYYIIYSLLVIYCFLYKLPPKQQELLIKFWIIIITLFGGLRWNTGYDWDSYYDIYKGVEWSNFLNYSKYGESSLQTIEPLYAFLNVFIKKLFGQYFVLNLLVSFFVHYSYYKFAKYHLPRCPILCFCFVEVVLVAFFPVRQTLAMAVLLWSFYFIKERKLLPYIIIVAAAFFIHRMSIVALPLYWIGKIRLKDGFIVVLFFSFIVVGKLLQEYFTLLTLLLGGQLGEIASTYSKNETVAKEGLPIITILLNSIFLFLYLFFRRKYDLTNDAWYNTLLNCFVLFFGVLFVFSNGMADMTRLQCIFLPGHILLFSSITASSLYKDSRILPSICKPTSLNHVSIAPIIRVFAVFFFYAYLVYRIPTCFSDYFFEIVCVPYRTILDFPYLI